MAAFEYYLDAASFFEGASIGAPEARMNLSSRHHLMRYAAGSNLEAWTSFFRVPDAYTGGTPKADIHNIWGAVGDGNARLAVGIQKWRPGDPLPGSIFQENFITFAVQQIGPAILQSTTITLTNFDSFAIGDLIRLLVRRVGADAADTESQDMDFFGIRLYE